MTGIKRKLIFWDSMLFIHRFDGTVQQFGPEVNAGVEETVDMFDKNTIVLATSVITISEVLEIYRPGDSYNKFRKVLERSNFDLVNIAPHIAEIAHDIRVYSMTNNPKLRTPDALQIAAAISIRCDEYCTLDDDQMKHSDYLERRYNLKVIKPNGTPKLFSANTN